MITCIAIDDEPLALELLANYCARTPFLELKRTFTKPSEAKTYLAKYPVDLLFLDILMPDISGIEFYKSLKSGRPVIFTTAFSEYAVEGFNLNAMDYLLKPIRLTRFEQAVKKIRDYFDYLSNRGPGSEKWLFVRSEYRLIRLAFADILYIQSLDNYVRIITSCSKPVVSKISMREISSRLPSSFLRIHRSYILNTDANLSYRNRTVSIGRHILPVGGSYEHDVMSFFGIDQRYPNT